MCEPIEGINEFFDDLIEIKRINKEFICNSLGDPDLIVLYRKINGKFEPYYHFLNGLIHYSSNDFQNYFLKLKNKQKQITYGLCYTWDIFLKENIIIQSEEENPYPIPNWKNLYLSSILRQFYIYQPLFCSIFGGKGEFIPNLHFLEFKTLNYEEIIYLLEQKLIFYEFQL